MDGRSVQARRISVSSRREKDDVFSGLATLLICLELHESCPWLPSPAPNEPSQPTIGRSTDYKNQKRGGWWVERRGRGGGGRLGWRGEEREKEGERCQSRHLELLQDPENQGSLKSVSLASALPTVLLVWVSRSPERTRVPKEMEPGHLFMGQSKHLTHWLLQRCQKEWMKSARGWDHTIANIWIVVTSGRGSGQVRWSVLEQRRRSGRTVLPQISVTCLSLKPFLQISCPKS